MKTIPIFALAVCLGVTATPAQQLPIGWTTGAGYETFVFGSADGVGVKSVSLLTLPLGARVRLGQTVTVDLQTAYAAAQLQRADQSESTVRGLTDTEVRVSLGLRNGAVQLTGVALLPTGQESMSLDNADVAGFVAADVLPFRTSNWGTGGGLGLNAAVTRSLGAYAGGLSLGYIAAREFEPIANSFRYRPGNQFSARAAIDRTIGNSGKASLVVATVRYAADRVDQTNLFQAGNRYEALTSYAFAAGGASAGIAYAGYLHRDEGEFLGTTELMPVEGLFFAGTGFDIPTRVGRMRPRADLRVLRRDNGVGQGYTTTVGADLEIPRARFTLIPGVRGRFGNVVLRQAAESGFYGLDLALFIRFGG